MNTISETPIIHSKSYFLSEISKCLLDENNHKFPAERFMNVDYQYWQQINNKLTNNTTPIFLAAVINRMVNIYDEWLTSYYN